ncbi:Hypothetical predicted protein [Xyrichtys novacula]|uniref:Uncharacterized protein n=1 Tax=Xyrichtys novacula TaxID=13765 RepID=A0AAV1HQC6_XYRNO|nr:Hypothetical predicted protein [Xyrichtys novacula]
MSSESSVINPLTRLEPPPPLLPRLPLSSPRQGAGRVWFVSEDVQKERVEMLKQIYSQ